MRGGTVHSAAGVWVGQLSWREPKEFLPRDADGELRLLHSASWRSPEPAVRDAERYLAQGKPIMFLTTCGHMLSPLKRALRQRGLPYGNPYRRKRLDWNPLVFGSDSIGRLLAFLRPWQEGPAGRTAGQMAVWTILSSDSKGGG